MFDQATMQKRFHDLGAERERILALSAPQRASLDALRAQIAALELQAGPLLAAVKQVEAPLFAIDQERAIIARALGGKTGAAA